MYKKLLLSFCMTAFLGVNAGFTMPKKDKEIGEANDFSQKSQKEMGASSQEVLELLESGKIEDLEGENSEESYYFLKKSFWQRYKKALIPVMVVAGLGLGAASYFLFPYFSFELDPISLGNSTETLVKNLTERGANMSTSLEDFIDKNLTERGANMSTSLEDFISSHIDHMDLFHNLVNNQDTATNLTNTAMSDEPLIHDYNAIPIGQYTDEPLIHNYNANIRPDRLGKYDFRNWGVTDDNFNITY